jgi:hypothetical protein
MTDAKITVVDDKRVDDMTTTVPVEATQAATTTTIAHQEATTIMTAHQEAAMEEATQEAMADQDITKANTLLVHPTAGVVAMAVARTISRVQLNTLRTSLETAATLTFSAVFSVCSQARRTSSRMRM